jgi:uncharacterized protein
MKRKTFEEILHKISIIKFNKSYDLVVGIALGGIVPAYLVQRKVQVPLQFIWINYRDEHHTPRGLNPRLLKPIEFEPARKKILLVDDRNKTGKTFMAAKKWLSQAKLIDTLVVNGLAEYSLYDEECFTLPWN